MKSILSVAMLGLMLATTAQAQGPVRYRVRVEDPSTRLYHLEVELPAVGDETLISLPSWTPGHYEIEDYARYVQRFSALDPSGGSLRWEKVDKDTWRIFTGGSDRVRVAYDFLADTVNLSGRLLRDDFGLFNGTNLFVYPETGYDFPSTIQFELPEGWEIATELEEAGVPGLYRAGDYHELVDNPTFVGHFGIDSLMADGVWTRLAVYPADRLDTPFGRGALDALQQIADYLHDFFGEEPPYGRYTTLIYLETEPLPFAGGLEHANSHLDILPASATENPSLVPLLFSLLSHEYFHAWNVKRIRPVEMWPYAYDREQFTPLLWLSEGITDYYADLVLARAGLWPEEALWGSIAEAIQSIETQPPTAVEDASLDTWYEPTAIASNFYYDKGKLIGLLLDALIRDASDGERGLDDVILRLYRDHYQEGRGFSTEDVMQYLGELIGEEAGDFYRRYIDGREPLPYDDVLARVGLLYSEETVDRPTLGVGFEPGPGGTVVVSAVVPGGSADEAGLRVGDTLLRLGTVDVSGPNWIPAFLETYSGADGQALIIAYQRDGQEMAGETRVRTLPRQVFELVSDPGADARAARLREGLLAN
jgi:predicted metalloprotease with PDZ domain